MDEKRLFRFRITAILATAIVLLLVFLIGSTLGQYAMSPADTLSTIFGGGTPRMKLAIFEFRLPRLCLAILVGIGMGAGGVIMQDLLHNDLASPGTLGVADGSSLFVTIYVALIAGKIDQPALLPVLAMVGGVISAVIIFLLGAKRDAQISPIRLVMTGVAMAAGYSAVSTFAMYMLDETQLEFIQRWQAGELWGTRWDYIAILAVWLLVFMVLTMLLSRHLNAIHLGYELATGLGVNVKMMFILLALLAVGMSSAAVAFGGNFFFLGLIGPHIARRIVGDDARFLIPEAGLVSALIITAANILVENVTWFVNIPTGIFVSILSVPYFIYLLMKAR